ncbi:MAG: dethiobiotin synthase [Planctomycetota bacterium]
MSPGRNARGLFIIGTDTGVGKSLVACAVVRILRAQGLDAVGFKPVATGQAGGVWGDAEALRAASDNCEALGRICPLCFALPLAPTLAAAHEGREPDMNVVREAFAALCRRHAAVIVEGIGGALVPLDRHTLVLDFAAQTGFALLLVCRAGLGTINHSLLTIREIERRGLQMAGLIMNVTAPPDSALADGARAEIERISGRRVLATVPFLDQQPGQGAPGAGLVARAVTALAKEVDFRTLLDSEGRL